MQDKVSTASPLSPDDPHNNVIRKQYATITTTYTNFTQSTSRMIKLNKTQHLKRNNQKEKVKTEKLYKII